MRLDLVLRAAQSLPLGSCACYPSTMRSWRVLWAGVWLILPRGVLLCVRRAALFFIRRECAVSTAKGKSVAPASLAHHAGEPTGMASLLLFDCTSNAYSIVAVEDMVGIARPAFRDEAGVGNTHIHHTSTWGTA